MSTQTLVNVDDLIPGNITTSGELIVGVINDLMFADGVCITFLNKRGIESMWFLKGMLLDLEIVD